eukprot:symbB.v1.2.021783.t2/scaffold1902.1/size96554/5
MVVPGLLESLSGTQPGIGVRKKSEWSSALEYIVEKMGAENVRITQIRLGTALLWTLVACCTIYRYWDMAQLRWVLMFHHLLAATGVDEGLLMSFSAAEPFVQRLLRPGSAVTPWMPGLLPRKQTVLGACVYATFLIIASFQLVTYRVYDQDVMIFTGVFLEVNTYVLLSCLYFWSGMYKLRGFFHGFVFQYQFLNFSGLSWYFRKCYLTKEYLPRPCFCAFGAFGTWIEMVAGLGMILGALPGFGEIFILLAAAMHVFIFFFGMGPFRWNVMTCYMLLVSSKLCMEGASPHHPVTELTCASLTYIAFFGLIIPSIGCLDPETLGRYFGGYRMATFHFAGNEMYHAMMISKAALAAHIDTGNAVQQLLLKRCEEYKRVTEDLDLFSALLYSDGLDVEGALRRGCGRVEPNLDFEDFDRKYMFVPITWLNCRGPLLNTKWDESLPITGSFIELVLEAMGFSEAQLPRGVALLFVAHAVPWLGGQRKRLELFDLADSKWSDRRWHIFLAVERGESVPPEEVVQSSMPMVVIMKNLDSHSELPEFVAQEIEILRAIYGEEPVRLIQHKKTDDEETPTICCLEVDLEPMTEEGVQLVCATLQLRIPEGYPTSSTPKVFVERSRGIGDVATEAMMDAAEKAVQHYGLQEEGCLAPLLSEVKDALGKAVSECYICMMDCDPSSAIFVACNCVFHRDCLEEWRGLKDKEKTAKADAATESIKSQRDALERLCTEADEQVEEADKQVAYSQLQVDRAASAVEQAMKKAQATAEDDEEQVPSEDEANEDAEDSDSSVELDTVDYRNEARWGAPEVSLGGLYHNKHTKKNWHPSVRMNRKRPKKYLKRVLVLDGFGPL